MNKDRYELKQRIEIAMDKFVETRTDNFYNGDSYDINKENIDELCNYLYQSILESMAYENTEAALLEEIITLRKRVAELENTPDNLAVLENRVKVFESRKMLLLTAVRGLKNNIDANMDHIRKVNDMFYELRNINSLLGNLEGV